MATSDSCPTPALWSDAGAGEDGGTCGPCSQDLPVPCLSLFLLLGQPHTSNSSRFNFKSRFRLCSDWDSKPKQCSGPRTAQPKELTLRAPEPLPTSVLHQRQRTVPVSLFQGPRCLHVAGRGKRKEPILGARTLAPQKRNAAPAAPNQKQTGIYGPPASYSSRDKNKMPCALNLLDSL